MSLPESSAVRQPARVAASLLVFALPLAAALTLLPHAGRVHSAGARPRHPASAHWGGSPFSVAEEQIQYGMGPADVMRKLGPPDNTRSQTEKEQELLWIYYCRDAELDLFFVNGKLKKEATLGYRDSSG